MASHRFTVTSSLSVQEAFHLLIDLERVSEWDDGIQSSTRIGGAESDVLGARFDVIVTGFDGRPSSVIYTITEVESTKRFVMVGSNAELRATDELTFEATAAGSMLTYVAELELLGESPPLTANQLDSMFPKIAAVAEDGLRRFLNPAPVPERAPTSRSRS